MQNDPDRVLHLLRRHEDGTFRRVSWETALDPGGVEPASTASSRNIRSGLA
jgi:hypothetical protein